MAECDEARQLLTAAYKDLRALQNMTDTAAFADEVFGFHAEQAIEKTLKAWLSLLGADPLQREIAITRVSELVRKVEALVGSTPSR